jgi:hypothetical protein
MNKRDDKAIASAVKLRKQVADAEALLGHLRAKLFKIEAKLAGEPPPETGLDRLWDAALPICRLRAGSQLKCRKAWERIPRHQRPKIADAVAALVAWNRCEEWRKDGGAFVCGLDRWIAEQRWTNIPFQPRDPTAPKPRPVPPAPSPEDALTPEEIARILHPENS